MARPEVQGARPGSGLSVSFECGMVATLLSRKSYPPKLMTNAYSQFPITND